MIIIMPNNKNTDNNYDHDNKIIIIIKNKIP